MLECGAGGEPAPLRSETRLAAEESGPSNLDERNTDVDTTITNPVLVTSLPKAGSVGGLLAPEESDPLAGRGFHTYTAPNSGGTAPFRATSYQDPDFHSSTPAPAWQYVASVANDPSLVTQILPFSLGQAVSLNSSPFPQLELPISKAEQGFLITAYLRETGTWCETTDSERHFTVSSVHEMMESSAFYIAAMALASKQLDTIRGRQREVTLLLYQHTIQFLIHQDPSQADATVLATCTLLCVYEMMASDVSEWRRHLKVSLRACANYVDV